MIDRIVTSRPLNKTAALVTGKGVHWEPAKEVIKPWDAWTDLPLPTRPITAAQLCQLPALTGRRIGRLTVVGYAGPGASGARWVVRCDCGMYGHQRTKSLTAGHAKTRGMCPRCDYLEELKAGRVPVKPL